MRLIATQQFHYNGKQRNIGDEFDAPPLHGKIFIENGRATDILEKSKLQTTAIKAEEPQKEKPIPNRRKRYMRRDMRADE